MEITIIIALSFIVGLLLGWVTLLWKTIKKHNRHLLQMELEFDSLKAKHHVCDTILDSHGENIEMVTKDVQTLKGSQSKMSDELLDLNQRINSLEWHVGNLNALHPVRVDNTFTDKPYDPLNPSQIMYNTNSKPIEK